MLVSLTGNIATDVKAQYLMKDGQYIPDNRTGKPLMVVEFQLAVSRGGRTKTTTDGKQHDSDLYRIKAIGQKAEFLSQYAVKGRGICIQGNLLQDEYLAQNQTIQIDRSNPMYNVLAQYASQPNSPVRADNFGNLYMVGNTRTKSITVEVVQADFTGANPNAQQFDQTAFVPNAQLPQGIPPQPQVGTPMQVPQQMQPPVPQQNYAPQQMQQPQYAPQPVPFGNNAPSNMVPNMAPQQGYAPVQQPAYPNMNNQVAPNMNGVSMQTPQQNPNGAMPDFSGWNSPSDVPADFTNIQVPQQMPVQQPAQQVAPVQQPAQTPQQQPKQEPAKTTEASTANFTPEQGGENQGF